MPYTTQWTPHGVIWQYTGVLTGEELFQSNISIYGDERFDSLLYQIVDLSEVESVTVTPAMMRKIAHIDMAAAHTNPRIRVASIGGDALTNIYCENASESHWPTQDFDSMDDALAWVTRKIKECGRLAHDTHKKSGRVAHAPFADPILQKTCV